MSANGNGNGNGMGWKIASVVAGILLGVLSWNATRLDSKVERLEAKGGTIEFLDRSRDDDRRKLEEINRQMEQQGIELARQGRLLSKMAARMGVKED
jgi:hypothetical protein